MTSYFQDAKITEFKDYSMYLYLILAFLGVWLLVLSILLYRIFGLFKKLTKETIESSVVKKEADLIEKRVANLEKESRFHIQKIGFIRFNPFSELGGDHSFSLAILDNEDSGIIITSLHTRDRTRVYMKDIKRGKCASSLSKEENGALEKASKK